ncbi:hypothetical protein H4582DRAFT_1933604 [Lactarius indigo]|nr:hypothetical protein H4582DRAFT_1933604 [Lactarius indigo]
MTNSHKNNEAERYAVSITLATSLVHRHFLTSARVDLEMFFVESRSADNLFPIEAKIWYLRYLTHLSRWNTGRVYASKVLARPFRIAFFPPPFRTCKTSFHWADLPRSIRNSETQRAESSNRWEFLCLLCLLLRWVTRRPEYCSRITCGKPISKLKAHAAVQITSTNVTRKRLR